MKLALAALLAPAAILFGFGGPAVQPSGSAAQTFLDGSVAAVHAEQAAQTTSVPEGPRTPPYRADRPIAIVGGLLIDATGALPRHDQTVIIDRGRIVEIGPMEQVKVPAGAHVIDATGMTIMPGLIDANCHIVLNPMCTQPLTWG